MVAVRRKTFGKRILVRVVASLCAIAALTTSVAAAPAAAAPAPPRNVEAYTVHYAEVVLARTYRTMFGRGPTASEREYWLWQIVDRPDAAWFAGRLMGTSTYKAGPGRLHPTAFVTSMLTNASGSADANLTLLWSEAIRNGTATRSRFLGWVAEQHLKPTMSRPFRRVSACRQFTRGGVVPLCFAGSSGHQRDVSIVNIPTTNIYVNRSWYRSAASFVAAARSAGYRLTAPRSSDIPSWMFAPGSWRSFDEQRWLYDEGYPANPPGRSMHEWGLAIDLDCNGKDITTQPACWNWVRANSKRYGVHLFRGVDAIGDSEAWHVSSNGY
jgi:hypothetical protein